MRVLGIDPGLADLGYGIVDYDEATRGVGHVDHGVIQTRAGDPMASRLEILYRELCAIIKDRKPNCAVVEALYFAKNVKTAVVVAQARGVAILATAHGSMSLAEYTPLQIKQALVGYGRADKRQVQHMVRAILGLDQIPRPDHAADALAAALCHIHGLRPLAAAAAEVEGETDRELNPNQILLAGKRVKKRRRSRV